LISQPKEERAHRLRATEKNPQEAYEYLRKKVKVKVKHSHYRPAVAQRVPGS
jgi:hypothetical protein